MPVRSSISLFLVILLALLLTTGPAWAADSAGDQGGGGHAEIPHSVIAVSVGYALERKRGKDEEAGAIGLEYEYRFAEHWGVGGVIEGLGADVIRDVSVAALISFHPAGHWRLFAGPGYEFTEKDDELLFRIGVGYEFSLGDHWTLAPELVADFIEDGKRTYILGLALGREF